MDRTILHCDMNSFYASVELLKYPNLKDKPMAVAGNPENRHGIILAKNEIAKKYGIVTAETIWSAKRKCPQLQLVPPNHNSYAYYSQLINSIYHRYTDMVEPFSIDESWLDVTGSLKLFGSGKKIADSIRETVKNELGLTLSAGVSYNKVFAKMGSEHKKPDATTLITRDNYKSLLWPKPAGELFFVGKATAEKLEKINIKTIGDIANGDPTALKKLLGKQGEQIYLYANGMETSPVLKVSEMEKIKSVGNGITFKRNLTGEEDIKTAITALSHTVAARLRHYRLKATGVKVDIKDPFFKVISRQAKVLVPTNLAIEISETAFNIITSSWDLNSPIRLLTITGINLVGENENLQLSLFAEEEQSRDKEFQLEKTMDSIKEKFGKSSITLGSIIGNDIGLDLYEETQEE